MDWLDGWMEVDASSVHPQQTHTLLTQVAQDYIPCHVQDSQFIFNPFIFTTTGFWGDFVHYIPD